VKKSALAVLCCMVVFPPQSHANPKSHQSLRDAYPGVTIGASYYMSGRTDRVIGLFAVAGIRKGECNLEARRA
jgi:hypothetical protein